MRFLKMESVYRGKSQNTVQVLECKNLFGCHLEYLEFNYCRTKAAKNSVKEDRNDVKKVKMSSNSVSEVSNIMVISAIILGCVSKCTLGC